MANEISDQAYRELANGAYKSDERKEINNKEEAKCRNQYTLKEQNSMIRKLVLMRQYIKIQ